MAVKIWYEAEDGTRFNSLEAACNYEYGKEKRESTKPPVFMDEDGAKSVEYNDSSVMCIFYDINDYETWLERAESEGNDFNEAFPHKDEVPDFMDSDGYFAVYWNDWLEEWEFYCWPELSDNYVRGQLIKKVLNSEGLDK